MKTWLSGSNWQRQGLRYYFVLVILSNDRRRILHFNVTDHPTARAQTLGIEEVLTAYRSPWQNPYAERFIGSIRRECLDHVIVLGPSHLKRIVAQYVDYYNGARTHLSLCKDSPDRRPVHSSNEGRIVEVRKVGGLHHQYIRKAA